MSEMSFALAGLHNQQALVRTAVTMHALKQAAEAQQAIARILLQQAEALRTPGGAKELSDAGRINLYV